ncbi:MAG: AAA family ATPase [Maricaulaceae bacterium]
MTMPALDFPLERRAAPVGRILAVASGKGGVGKTFVSLSLAHAFAARGEKTLLFDGDLGMANVDIQLGVTPAADLGSVVSGHVALEDAVSEVRPGGFDVIAGLSGSGALASLSVEEVAGLAAGLAAVSLSYDRVVLDLAAGVDPAMMRLACAADDVLMVINDEPTSLTDAYAFIKMLRMRDEDAEPVVVVNLVDEKRTPGRAYETIARSCENFLGFRPHFAGSIRRDDRVPDAIRHQTLLAVRHPQADAVSDIVKLAAVLARGARAGH